ncbi:hypothetical protein SCHPADRAFT_887051 [Schizopora paradoxa]|uniref:Arrestin-like N-terminal domain-containing protein n=1 Tax=Schizopora paradoxa TaxID=27342 RepID=A0A0H2S720_9AGAM|nr:hypothetical protein SCHPADRAFT_887051 [Schizopora paradoxa]
MDVKLDEASSLSIRNPPHLAQEFYLADDDGFHTIKLKVLSMAQAPSEPSYLEGQAIEGEVTINSRKPESVKSVSISLIGTLRYSGMDDRSFLTISKTLWQHQSEGSSFVSEVVGYSNKLEGQHNWPFSFSLPEYVRLGKKLWHDVQSEQDVRLPPTTLSKSFEWDIFYTLVVEVKRVGFLSSDDTLKQSIVYTPLIREPTPFPSRLQAYKDGTPLLSPQNDPQGWKTFSPVEIEGKLEGTGKVKGTYSLAIAAPLAYSEGSLIPIYLTVESEDEGALAHFADPTAPNVTIYHRLRNTSPGVDNVGGYIVLPGNESNRPLGKAVWAKHVENKPGIKVLYGEIKLPENLRPTFIFGDVGVQYFVEAYAPTIPGFEPASHRRLFEAEVEICNSSEQAALPAAWLKRSLKLENAVLKDAQGLQLV